MTPRSDIALVTGAGGFIGVNLCPALVDAGFETHAIVRPGGGGHVPPLPAEATFIRNQCLASKVTKLWYTPNAG